MDRSELQFTLADLVCAMLLLSALIGTLATHADHAHYIWYYLPVLVVCEVAGFVISYAIFRGPRARRSAITAVWTTAVGSLIGIVMPIAMLMSLPMLPLGFSIRSAFMGLFQNMPSEQPVPPNLAKIIADVKQQASKTSERSTIE